jgi:hypothetical protein
MIVSYCRDSIADGVESDLSLVHPDDVDWFITLDETHHELTTRGNKGGSTTVGKRL